jgi:hypothetical protein
MGSKVNKLYNSTIVVKSFYYLERTTGRAIQVFAEKRPSTATRDQRMVVSEWSVDKNAWQMANLPEVSWHTLSKMIYLGQGDKNA